MSKEILRCPFCNAGQGEISSRISYIRLGGAVHFEPIGTMQLDCYASKCRKTSFWKRNTEGKLIQIQENSFKESIVIQKSDI